MFWSYATIGAPNCPVMVLNFCRYRYSSQNRLGYNFRRCKSYGSVKISPLPIKKSNFTKENNSCWHVSFWLIGDEWQRLVGTTPANQISSTYKVRSDHLKKVMSEVSPVDYFHRTQVSLVQSLCPDVRPSLMLCRLNWCDSGWWGYQLNTNW